ncbi:MAG: pseudouridine-5'-phosphate glycosidase [Candidatus Izemoplasmatales bacterium]|nr:pseudouridine-5'-phosphate glycosidase [Candidatus Izemoplasmatales bacterium]MDD3864910.1 pseudouridine-5'-phosphate glycosidase [Candidatus Izemoplasmatales bacterium]
MRDYLKINPEVNEALARKQPVVALESTIISHGMPYPENVKTALACEAKVREAGAIPATIAIIDGKIIVGLTVAEIELIGQAGETVVKTSRRDLPYVISNKLNGALTVSGTMIVSALAGIKFFATGGIGGVHRGAEITMDISADLEELAHTNVCVVCAGIKSILDLPKTLEYLETKGVPVLGYQTDSLPAFYLSTSPYKVNYQLKTPQAIAQLAKTKWDLGLQGGIVVTNPIPKALSADPELIDQAIDQALKAMQAAKIQGKESTPFLLKRVAEITGGQSLQANIALVLNNCRLAAEIAKAYWNMED